MPVLAARLPVIKSRVAFKARTIEDGPRRIVLRERGGIVELVSGNVILLSSAALETERAFGRLAAKAPDATDDGRALSVIVGGLGFGMTVRGVLDAAPANARIVVVEKIAAVERLVRGELAYIASQPLDDPRVSVVVGDVANVISSCAPGDVDAILLDVDNGPNWASFRENARLYTPSGLAATMRALSPGGLLAVWSGYPADAFLVTLRRQGFRPTVVPLRERTKVRARAYIGERPR